MNKKKLYVIAALIVLIAGGYFWYNRNNAKDNKVEYVTAKASRGTLTSSISGSGNIIVDNQSNIDPTITGTVSNLSAAVGDKVIKGQLLFIIENNDLSVAVSKAAASVSQAESSLKSAKASRKKAQSEYNSIKDQSVALIKKQAAKESLDAAEAAVHSAEQSLLSAQADLANQKSDAVKRRVVSPINGTVNAVNIKNGDDLSKLSSGTTRQVPIIIGDLETLKAEVAINEVDIANVSIGQKVELTFDAMADLKAAGKVEKVDSLGTVTQGVVTYNVTISLDNLNPKIKPQMSVSASIINDVKQDVIIIPSSAVKTENGFSYVEVLVENRPQRKKVTIGASNDTETEIASGLNVGDEIVTETTNSSEAASTSSGSGSGSRNSGSGANIRVPGMRGFGG